MTNDCRFEGRLSAAAEAITLPSGDVVVVFRLIVPRDGESRVDTIECRVDVPKLQTRVLAIAADTQLSIEGALHRRFWKTAHGPVSRYEVQVRALRKCR